MSEMTGKTIKRLHPQNSGAIPAHPEYSLTSRSHSLSPSIMNLYHISEEFTSTR